jgi:hypothetical protein
MPSLNTLLYTGWTWKAFESQAAYWCKFQCDVQLRPYVMFIRGDWWLMMLETWNTKTCCLHFLHGHNCYKIQISLKSVKCTPYGNATSVHSQQPDVEIYSDCGAHDFRVVLLLAFDYRRPRCRGFDKGLHEDIADQGWSAVPGVDQGHTNERSLVHGKDDEALIRAWSWTWSIIKNILSVRWISQITILALCSCGRGWRGFWEK